MRVKIKASVEQVYIRRSKPQKAVCANSYRERLHANFEDTQQKRQHAWPYPPSEAIRRWLTQWSSPWSNRPLSGANLSVLIHAYRRKVNIFLILSFSFRCLSKLGCPAPYSARRSPKFAGADAALRSFTCSRPKASAKCPIPERPSAASASALYLVLVLIS